MDKGALCTKKLPVRCVLYLEIRHPLRSLKGGGRAWEFGCAPDFLALSWGGGGGVSSKIFRHISLAFLCPPPPNSGFSVSVCSMQRLVFIEGVYLKMPTLICCRLSTFPTSFLVFLLSV
jgi:hypothetical protein